MYIQNHHTPTLLSVGAVPSTNSGLTAIELLVTLGVVGVLAAIAAPSLSPLMDRWRVMQATEQLKSTLYFARSEAIKRGGGVLVQKLPNQDSCTSATTNQDWDCGWFVCLHALGANICTDDDPVLQRYDSPARIKVTRSGGGASIKFDRWGKVAGTWPSFGLTPLGQSTTHPAARRLCMGSGGRIRTPTTATC